MKSRLLFLLSFISIFSFGQSDLEVEIIKIGNKDGYRSQKISWEIKVNNLGVTDASIVPFKLFVSEDQKIDGDDIEIEIFDSNVWNDPIVPLEGLKSGSEVTISSKVFRNREFYFPPLLDFNKQYYFIFKIEQDVNGGEANLSNNIAVKPFYLLKEDKLIISEADPFEPLGNRTPLILIHGWQPMGYDSKGDISIWDNFLKYYNYEDKLSMNFKLYYVIYNSNIVPVNDLGHELFLKLNDKFKNNYEGNINIIAHSMGGLVARSYMNRIMYDSVSQKEIRGGDRVNKLITLGTPHHGSPMANGEIRIDYNANLNPITRSFLKLPTTIDLSESLDLILYGLPFLYDDFIQSSQRFSRWDLRWDNFDDFYDYSEYDEEVNIWLGSEKMNGDATYNKKIIAYAGEIFNKRNKLTDINVQTLKYYFLGEKFLSKLNLPNDGIVPFKSAKFEDGNIDKVRVMYDYYHDEIAKGRFDYLDENGLDLALFGLIKADLLGNVSNPVISSLPNKKINFSETALGNMSFEEIQIINSGDLKITINNDDIQIIGVDNQHFKFDFPTGAIQLEPNEKKNFEVSFMPLNIGEKTVVFRINNNSINNPQLDIELKGIGVEAAETDYSTNIDKNFDFGDVYIYEGVKLVYSSVSNSSSASYTVDSLHIKGNDSNLFKIVQQPDFPKDFKPGDSEPIILSFDPDTVGEKNAIIEAHFKDSSILDSANLLGNGIKTYTDVNTSKLSLYEYWFNDDYLDKKSVNLTTRNSEESLNHNVKTDGIKQGLNILRFRIKDEKNQWSSILSDYIYVQNSTSTGRDVVTNYEYWFDDNYSSKTSENTSSNGDSYILELNKNISSIGSGMHQLHIRFKDAKGNWSSVNSEFVYNTKRTNSGDNKINQYRYWFNDDSENKVSKSVDSENLLFLSKDINVSNLVNNSLNYIHLQFKDSNGSWSSVITEEFLNETTLDNEYFGVDKFNLYPNPSNSKVYLTTKIKEGKLFIYNTLGKRIKVFNSIPAYVDVSNLKSGLYIFKIKSENKIYQEKVIKF